MATRRKPQLHKTCFPQLAQRQLPEVPLPHHDMMCTSSQSCPKSLFPVHAEAEGKKGVGAPVEQESQVPGPGKVCVANNVRVDTPTAVAKIDRGPYGKKATQGCFDPPGLGGPPTICLRAFHRTYGGKNMQIHCLTCCLHGGRGAKESRPTKKNLSLHVCCFVGWV